MNDARFDDNGRLVHEKSRDRTVTDHVVTRVSFSEIGSAHEKAWTDIDTDTRVSIVRALLGAMSDEEHGLLASAMPEAIDVERLADNLIDMREAMADALEVTHPEMGAPEWGQLLEIAADNADIVRRMRDAMSGTMGEE